MARSKSADDGPDTWDGYARSVVELQADRRTVIRVVRGIQVSPWPFAGPVHVITAANPGSRRVAERENHRRNHRLGEELRLAGVPFVPAVGYSPDLVWVEASFGLLDQRIGTSLHWASRFGQVAVFACHADRFEVVGVDGRVTASHEAYGIAVDVEGSVLRRAFADAEG